MAMKGKGWIIQGPVVIKQIYPKGLPIIFWPVAAGQAQVMAGLIEARSIWHQCWEIPSAPRMA